MTSVVSHQSFVPQLHQLSSQMNIGPIGFNSYISHVARIDADTQFNSNRLNLNQMKACIHTFFFRVLCPAQTHCVASW